MSLESTCIQGKRGEKKHKGNVRWVRVRTWGMPEGEGGREGRDTLGVVEPAC